MKFHVTCFLFIAFFPLHMWAQDKEDPHDNGYHYYPIYGEVFADFAGNTKNKEEAYRAYGAEARFGWGTDQKEKFQFCGLWSAGAGYGSRVKPDRKFYLPLNIAFTFSGSCRFAKTQSAGVIYDFIGIYGWSQTALAGSMIGVTYRFKDVQVECTRSGDGFIKGAFTNKPNQNIVFGANVAVWIYDEFQFHLGYITSELAGMRQWRTGIRWLF